MTIQNICIEKGDSMEESMYRLIHLACLLRNIGKFLQGRPFPSLTGESKSSQIWQAFAITHNEVFARYVDTGLLQQLICHDYEKTTKNETNSTLSANELECLREIISQAEQLSSGGSLAANVNDIDIPITPLASVFSRIQIDPGKPCLMPRYYVPNPLSPQAAFPELREKVNGSFQVHLNNLQQSFEARFSSLAQESKNLEFPAFITRLLALLQEYTWAFPSNSNEEIADISLFDHLKTTTAIAAALYLYHCDGNDFSIQKIRDLQEYKFRLVVGDISGIQNYIFSNLARTSKGVAKTLRARSLILAMLSELISHRVLELFNLSLANILMASGGKFYILVPNIQGSEARIMSLQEEIDRLLLKQYRGEIGLNLGHVAMNGTAFQAFDKVINQAGQVLNQRKARPFQTVLQEQTQWSEVNFLITLEGNPDNGICGGCGKAFADRGGVEEDFCTHCLNERELGKRLTRATSICFYHAPEHIHNKFQLLGEYWIGLELEPDDNGLDRPYLVVKFNDPDLSGLYQPGYFRFVANYVPVEPSGVPLDFDKLAETSVGRHLLGYLKCDVDNLGAIFRCGLYENETRSYNNIARLTTLSRMLDLFFAGFVNQLLIKKYSDCYTVFSGGDDLFLIGPWDRIIDLALDIRQEFNRFVTDNPNITLSAGISVSKARFPVSRAAGLAEEFLESAKETLIKGQNSSRNQIHVFGRTIRWPDFEMLLAEAKQLAKLDVPDVFLYRLIEYESMFQQYYGEGKINGLKYISLLCYDLARNFKKKEDEIRKWAEELKDVTKKKTIYLRFILEYVINLTREA
jgi:CRISPR-associated protein Csm1